MRLTDLVSVDNRFEKSINLLLDLNNEKKVADYIPTRSSVAVLRNYLDETLHYTGARATALIGPYGKGKSHLLLVVLYLLSTQKTSIAKKLAKRIASVDPECKELLGNIINSKSKFLPVILNVNSGSNLDQTMIRSLSLALRREKLSDVAPDSYFTMATETIEQWKRDYPQTYEAFENILIDYNSNIPVIEKGLSQYDLDSLELFKMVYPKLTSGSSFNPVINEDALSVYRSVNRRLHDKYGYKGIFIVFDEFSKYIEGHSEVGFSEDMKSLQDMCELCNTQSEEQLHLVCVAHKSIKSYGDSLPKSILNTFKGVEGRLKEWHFVVSSKNSYELIADAIHKTSYFDVWKETDADYIRVTTASNTLRCFSSQFDLAEYRRLIAVGCYPLTPLSASLLLELSERIAQNERTIFTFITGKDRFSLNSFIKENDGIEYVGANQIYDYFEQIFREDVRSAVHNEWLKADFALDKAKTLDERMIIKALAVIRMVNNQRVYSESKNYIQLATGLNDERFAAAFDSLLSDNVIEYKVRSDSYAFKNEVTTNIDAAIMDCIKKKYTHADITGCLNEIVSDRFIAPKKHNQNYCITRYFDFVFMSGISFDSMQSTEYLSMRNRPDGIIVLIMPGQYDESLILSHLNEINEDNVIVCLPKSNEPITEKIQHLLAVRSLKNDSDFIDNNPVLRRELYNIEEEIIDDINEWIDDNYLRTDSVLTHDGIIEVDSMGINRIVSNICDELYCEAPIINHELINRHDLSGQMLKARSTLIEGMIKGIDFTPYFTASSAEATVYRATVAITNDPRIDQIRDIISRFITDCVGQKIPFSDLFSTLMRQPYGMRLGVIPLFLADTMFRMEDLPVIYLNDKEVPVDAGTFNALAKNPKDYYLFVEKTTAEKTNYIRGLITLFSEFDVYCAGIDKKNSLSRVTCLIQSWYRSLPQSSVTFQSPDYDGQDINAINDFRSLFSGYSINPRDTVLEKLLSALGTDYSSTCKKVAEIKKDIDEHIHRRKKTIENVLRQALMLSDCDDLCQSLKSWLNSLPKAIKQTVFSYHTRMILNYINDLKTHDEEDIIGHIAHELTGTYVEDWNDSTEDSFKKELLSFKNEIETVRTDNDPGQKISISSSDGSIEEVYYKYDDQNISTNGQYFKNALDELMEEYGGMVDHKEKVGILMAIIKDLIK